MARRSGAAEIAGAREKFLGWDRCSLRNSKQTSSCRLARRRCPLDRGPQGLGKARLAAASSAEKRAEFERRISQGELPAAICPDAMAAYKQDARQDTKPKDCLAQVLGEWRWK